MQNNNVIYLKDAYKKHNEIKINDLYSKEDTLNNIDLNTENNSSIQSNEDSLIKIYTSQSYDESNELADILNKIPIYSIVKAELIGLERQYSVNVFSDGKEKATEIIITYKNKLKSNKILELQNNLECGNCHTKQTFTENNLLASWKKTICPDSIFLVCSKCGKGIRVITE